MRNWFGLGVPRQVKVKSFAAHAPWPHAAQRIEATKAR